jgi:tRNA 2-thiouridine synthesizing protein E
MSDLTKKCDTPNHTCALANLARDKEGYLKNLADWNPNVAAALAAAEGIELSDAHWEIIHAIREFYQQFDHCPNNRILVKHIKQTLSDTKGNSIYLLGLFPEAPAKKAAKIAGLPRPTHCL